MTRHLPQNRLRFYMTATAPCPYLPGREERKVFVNLPFGDGADVNDELTQSGFRRSQNIAYRPACDLCDACVSVRIPVGDFRASRTQKRISKRNAALRRDQVEAEATVEQFDLLRRYLLARHAGGGMSDMGWHDYVAMVEDTSVRTHLMEYRRPSEGPGPGDLMMVTLVDRLSDGLSMVYSFYEPDLPRHSLGQFAILDHVAQVRSLGLDHVYLGYWVQNSQKMDYKARIRPLQALTRQGWRDMPSL